MKSNAAKNILLSFTLIMGIFLTLTAESATISGTLGPALMATDSYAFTCPTGTTQSRIRVMDLNTVRNSLATVVATFGEDGSPTLAVSDSESTSTGSVFATNTLDGPGIYAVVVNKTAINVEDYSIEAQCLNALGVSLVTRLIPKTNQ
jgi:hypothetical protein